VSDPADAGAATWLERIALVATGAHSEMASMGRIGPTKSAQVTIQTFRKILVRGSLNTFAAPAL
jgi:hypothetical protein